MTPYFVAIIIELALIYGVTPFLSRYGDYVALIFGGVMVMLLIMTLFVAVLLKAIP